MMSETSIGKAGINIWNAWIKPEPWRTLVAFESEAAGRAAESGIQSWVSTGQAERNHTHFELAPLVPGAAVVYSAGRDFLIGLPAQSVEALAERWIEDVIMLSSEPAHTSGLCEYLKRRRGRALRIWTSNWIWEDLERTCDLARELKPRPFASLPKDKEKAPGRSAFEQSLFQPLGPQISLSLEYVVDSHPRLFATFRFGHRELFVVIEKPRGVTVPVGSPVTGRLPLLPDLATYETRFLQRIYRTYSIGADRLKKGVGARLLQLNKFHSGLADQSPGPASDWCGDWKSLLWQLGDPPVHALSEFTEDCRAAMVHQGKPDPVLNVQGAELSVADAEPPRSAGEDPARISIVIGAGAVIGSSSARIQPDRTVLVGHRNIGLLALKVLDALCTIKDHPDSFTGEIYVAVSPETEAAVYQIIADLKRMLSEGTDRIVPLRQRLIPNATERGFDYVPAGHKEIIALLPRSGHGYFYTNFNNLARNTSGAMQLAAHAAASGAPLVFEVVPYLQDTGAIQGSYWVRTASGKSRLVKPAYLGLAKGVFPGDSSFIPAPDNLLTSAGACFVRPEQLPAALLDGAVGDMDHLTWDIDTATSIRLEGERFIPVKTEQDIFRQRFESIQRESSDLVARLVETEDGYRLRERNEPILPAESAEIRPEVPQVLKLAGVPQDDPWGGREWIRPPNQVSEEWMFSMLASGVASVMQNSVMSRPLTHLLPQGPLLMAKFLDCADWLSLQLHPNQETCDIIEDKDGELRETVGKEHAQFDHVGLLDRRGKEEVFHVIHAAQDSKFYLGFEADRFRQMVRDLPDPTKNADDFISALLHSPQWRLGHLATPADVTAVESDFTRDFAALLNKEFKFCLELRRDYDRITAGGMAFIFALRALRQVVANQPDLIPVLYSDKSPLLRFFHAVESLRAGVRLRIPPGVIHAAGPGLFMVEASHCSDNTLRIFDHGREHEDSGRPLHYTLAALAVSRSSFLGADREGSFVARHGASRFGSIETKTYSGGPKPADRECTQQGPLAVLCTRGRIAVSVQSAGRPQDLLELQSTGAAFVPANPDRKVLLTAPENAPSECVVVSLATQAPEPVLCLTLGTSHFGIIFHDELSEPKEESNSWRPASRSWDDRIQQVDEVLDRFLCGKRKPRLMGISWAGQIEGKTLRAETLGLAEFKSFEKAFGRTLERFLVYPQVPPRVVFNATADLAAEAIGRLGHISEPTMLLTFSSGVSLALFDANDGKATLIERTEGVPIRHFGRILWMDSSTHQWSLSGGKGKIRLSRLLSVPALILRLARDLHARQLLSTLAEHADPGVKEVFEVVGKSLRSGNPSSWDDLVETHVHLLIERAGPTLSALGHVDPHSPLGGVVRDFVDSVALDFARMIRAAVTLVPGLSAYSKHVLIGGLGGKFFGTCASGDVFITSLRKHLGDVDLSRALEHQAPFGFLEVCKALEDGQLEIK